MKKNLAMFTVLLLMLVGLGACGKKASTTSKKIFGTWKITAMKVNGKNMPLPPAAITMEFKKDGTYIGKSGGKDREGTWTLNKTVLKTKLDGSKREEVVEVKELTDKVLQIIVGSAKQEITLEKQ